MSIRSSIGSRRSSSGAMYCSVPVRLPGRRNAGRVRHREPEIDQLDVLLAVDQEIPRVDVVMDESRRMDGGQPFGGLGQQLDLLRGAGRPRLADILEAHPVDEFHHEVMLALGRVAVLERAHDVGMHQLDRDLPLGGPRLLGGGPRGGRLVLLAQLDLQADRPARLVIDRAVDPRHAAARRLRDDREPALEIHAAPVHARPASTARGEHLFQLPSIETLSSCSGRVGGRTLSAGDSIHQPIHAIESSRGHSPPHDHDRGGARPGIPSGRSGPAGPTNRSGRASPPEPAPVS